jgi:hypothetical protein
VWKSSKINKYVCIYIMSKINENGFWEGLEASSEHRYDENLSDALLTFLKTEKVKTLCDF